jgi:acetyl esterase/lipase
MEASVAGALLRLGAHRAELGRRFALLLTLVAVVGGAGRLPSDEPPLSTSTAVRDDVEPGSIAYRHHDFRVRKFGEGAQSYWLLEPIEPIPDRAPVVVFLHGWMSINTGIYGAWLEHLARRGAIVIFPRYQVDMTTPPAEFLPNARSAIADAIDVLRSRPGSIRPDLERFALVGHSAGGNLAAQLAAEPGVLPTPCAVVAVMPGEVLPQSEPRLERIPAATLLVVVAGDRDRVVGDHRARQIFRQATAVPPERKEYVLYRTDRSGPFPLLADHHAPTAALARLDTGEGPFRAMQMASASVDPLDRFGFWRLTDLTLQAAFSGQTLDDATHQGALIRDLGRWGRGEPVRPPLCGDDLDAIPRVVPSHGARLFPWPASPRWRLERSLEHDDD